MILHELTGYRLKPECTQGWNHKRRHWRRGTDGVVTMELLLCMLTVFVVALLRQAQHLNLPFKMWAFVFPGYCRLQFRLWLVHSNWIIKEVMRMEWLARKEESSLYTHDGRLILQEDAGGRIDRRLVEATRLLQQTNDSDTSSTLVSLRTSSLLAMQIPSCSNTCLATFFPSKCVQTGLSREILHSTLAQTWSDRRIARLR